MISGTDVNNIPAKKERRERSDLLIGLTASTSEAETEWEKVENIKQLRWACQGI